MKSYYPPGTTVTYVCRPGYEPTELMPSATCLENVTWSESPEFCTRKSCPAPEGPKNGRVVDGTDYLFGTRVNIICNDGFKLRGRNFIQCVLNGNPWTQLPTCEAISCLPPLNISHGSHSRLGEEEFAFGSAVTYSCDEGYSLVGKASIRCTTNDQVNGEWSGPAPECKAISCLPPLNISHGSHNRLGEEEFAFGSGVTYICDEGFSLIGEASIHCRTNDQVNGEWSGRAPECKGKPCRPLEVENGRVQFIDLQFGATVSFSCDDGYRMIGPASAQCVLRGNGVDWDKEVPRCKAISCLPPLNISHGSHSRLGEEEFAFGSAVTYSCDEGFSLVGKASIHCTTNDQVNGEWSGPAPECKAIPCLPPPNIPHGSHNHLGEEEFAFGSAVTYSCDEGFSLVGEASIRCTTNDRISGEWSGPAPECNGKFPEKCKVENPKSTSNRKRRSIQRLFKRDQDDLSPDCKDSASDTAANSPQAGDEDIKKPIIITLIVSGAIIAIGSLAMQLLAAFARKHPGKIWRKKKRSYNVSLDSSVC